MFWPRALNMRFNNYMTRVSRPEHKDPHTETRTRAATIFTPAKTKTAPVCILQESLPEALCEGE